MANGDYRYDMYKYQMNIVLFSQKGKCLFLGWTIFPLNFLVPQTLNKGGGGVGGDSGKELKEGNEAKSEGRMQRNISWEKQVSKVKISPNSQSDWSQPCVELYQIIRETCWSEPELCWLNQWKLVIAILFAHDCHYGQMRVCLQSMSDSKKITTFYLLVGRMVRMRLMEPDV